VSGSIPDTDFPACEVGQVTLQWSVLSWPKLFQSKSSMDLISRLTSLVATMVRHVEIKALPIHNLYVVGIKGTKKYPPQPIRSCHSLWRHWSAPCVENGRYTFMIFRTDTCHFHSICQRRVTKIQRNTYLGMPRDKNKGLHGNCPIGINWAMPNQNCGIPSVLSTQCPENLFLD
jgi:hypothetical protein